MPFGQVVMGAAGAGKTTYAKALAAYLRANNRPVCLVSLDPAAEDEDSAEDAPTAVDVDVRELVRADDVAREQSLGPNGALVFAADYLCANSDWLVTKLRPYSERGCFFVFDCPGQLELFQSRGALRGTVEVLAETLGMRLCCVHLTDSHMCADGFKYVSALLSALSAMLFFDMPHICVLSKCDLVTGALRREMDMPFRFYRGGGDVTKLADVMEYRRRGFKGSPMAAMTRNLLELVEDYGLVGFEKLAVEDVKLLARLTAQCDRAVGYVPTGASEGVGGGVSSAHLLGQAFSDDSDDDEGALSDEDVDALFDD